MRAPLAEKIGRPIESLRVGSFRIPTDFPESDGTLAWESTTLIVVEVEASGETGVGYTYADAGVAVTIRDLLAGEVRGCDALDVNACWSAMVGRLRNLGRQGASATAVSAIDTALWDLKAKIIGLPLVELLGAVRAELPVYGSGGFTSYPDERLETQFADWSEMGISRFKMKVGREPERDPARIRAARNAIGPNAELFVDANSAYSRRQALEFAQVFAGEFDVRWLEQPLPPEDLAGLRFLRERGPAQLEIVDGEYGYDLDYFRRLLVAEAVDVVMADLTRCGGITGFLRVAVLCEAWQLPLSSHCAPSLHLHPGCAVVPMRHAEYFHDHVRIERELFDGFIEPEDGAMRPDTSRAGLGLQFKWADAARYAV